MFNYEKRPISPLHFRVSPFSIYNMHHHAPLATWAWVFQGERWHAVGNIKVARCRREVGCVYQVRVIVTETQIYGTFHQTSTDSWNSHVIFSDLNASSIFFCSLVCSLTSQLCLVSFLHFRFRKGYTISIDFTLTVWWRLSSAMCGYLSNYTIGLTVCTHTHPGHTA